MDAEYLGLQQGGSSSSSSSCRTADAVAWGAAQQQKRQRCQGSSSTSGSLKISEPEPQDLNPVGIQEEEEEDYYMEDDCDDDGDGYDEDDYDFDEADFNQHLADKFDDLDLPPGVEATVPWLQKIAPQDEVKEPSKSTTADENANKYKQFKQFDTVQNFSDHHFAKNFQGEPARAWSKRVQHDWKLLEKDLPASIYVRVAEDRIDLLRAAIIGPKGTPYHDGIFFFDVHIPSSYPSGPPLVHYHSGGLRINPNLYNCGKVCLSLLGTWSGNGCEKWNPAQSTLLQVLVSIQALILNENPYYNEPGYEASANTPHGQRKALEYNDNTFLHSCRTMLYSLRRPPEHFADLVAGHFRVHGHIILAACKHYMEGHDVGSVVPEEEEESDCKSSEAWAAGSSSSSSSSSSNAPKPGAAVNATKPLSRRVDIPLMRFVKGKGGSMQKKIEEDTGVKIIFPSSREETSVVLKGTSSESIRKASQMIAGVLEEAIQSRMLDYSHFVSLPLAIHPDLVDKLNYFQSSILGDSASNEESDQDERRSEGSTDEMDHDHKQADGSSVSIKLQVQEESVQVKMDNKGLRSDFGIDKSIFIKPKTFHLTVVMLKLWNKDRIAKASEVLQSISGQVNEALENRPISIQLRGLTCMKGSPAKARVVYAPVLEVGGEGRLARACKVIIDAFVKSGLVLERDARQELKLHATIMNVRHRKSKKRDQRNDSFDARGIFRKHGKEEWGEYLIPEVHLSQRFKFDESGYYHCCSSIPLPAGARAE